MNAQIATTTLFALAVLALHSLINPCAMADERIRTKAQLIKEGYHEQRLTRLIPIARLSRNSIPVDEHSLDWPVLFKDKKNSLGNSMAQFQPFDNPPYFHGGDDLLIQEHAEVHAPISGKIEAGHYSYSTNPDGSLTKYWKPWPTPGDETYFEIAIITDLGFRFEFHHLDEHTIPESIIEKLKQKDSTIERGTILARAASFPVEDYQHIHYNIYSPDRHRINPEIVTKLIPDSIPPKVKGVYAIDKSEKVQAFNDGTFAIAPKEFLIAVQDMQDENTYDHPPAKTVIHFDQPGVDESGWDFTHTLTTFEGKFPPIWEVLRKTLRTPDGKFLRTTGGYGTGLSIFRLSVPANATGSFQITVADIAGNKTEFTGRIGN